ncbi:HTH domain-containing protein [Natronorarus salvus]|uniref:HTH domain-containing protein n=1 Tax=Natronorarus salvus TaxID=3117733 RepID=UPI002F265C9F
MIGSFDDPLDIDLYLREGATSARPRQDALRARLDRLASTPLVSAYRTHTWPARVSTDGDPERIDRIEEWEAWAESRGVSLAPAFERHEAGSLVSEAGYEEVVLPVVWIDVTAGDERLIAPHVGETPFTVPEFVTALETRDGPGDVGPIARTVA